MMLNNGPIPNTSPEFPVAPPRFPLPQLLWCHIHSNHKSSTRPPKHVSSKLKHIPTHRITYVYTSFCIFNKNPSPSNKPRLQPALLGILPRVHYGGLANAPGGLAYTRGGLAYTWEEVAYTQEGLAYSWEGLALHLGRVSIHSGRVSTC